MDFNGDNKKDLLIGCFEGFVYIVYGKENGDFSLPEKLLDKDKNPIELGEFWDYKNKQWGETKVPNPEAKDLCVYPLAIDWDNDGDLDILLGGYRGILGVRINEGGAKKASYSTRNIGVKLGTSSGSGAVSPAWADWDGDGLKDLICGYSQGQMVWYKNNGNQKAPKFESGKIIQNTEMQSSKSHPSSYLKIDVDDFNRDQKLDLIVGAKDENGKGKIWIYLRD